MALRAAILGVRRSGSQRRQPKVVLRLASCDGLCSLSSTPETDREALRRGEIVDYGGEQNYTPPIVDSQNATPGQVLLGHLAITVPVVLAVPLVVYWGLGEFGPPLWPYYVTAGLALAWQWYSIALPRWKGGLLTEDVARRSGLEWPGAAAIGSFALHTTAVPLCGIILGGCSVAGLCGCYLYSESPLQRPKRTTGCNIWNWSVLFRRWFSVL
jgi:hypothetical protein